MSEALVADSRAVLAKHARSFRTASLLLPSEARDDAAVLYAFCRLVDDIADEDSGRGRGGHVVEEAPEPRRTHRQCDRAEREDRKDPHAGHDGGGEAGRVHVGTVADGRGGGNGATSEPIRVGAAARMR